MRAASVKRTPANPMGSTASSVSPSLISTTDVAHRNVTMTPMVTAAARPGG